MSQYKVVPFIGTVRGGAFSKENASTVSAQLQALIGQHAREGWELQGIEKVGIEVQPGCIAGLLGAKPSNIDFDQVIFRRAD